MKDYTIDGLDFQKKDLGAESLILIYRKGGHCLSEYDFQKYGRDFAILGYDLLCAEFQYWPDEINESLADAIGLDCTRHRALWMERGIVHCLEEEYDCPFDVFTSKVKCILMRRHSTSGRQAILARAFPISGDYNEEMLYNLENPRHPRLLIQRNMTGDGVRIEIEGLGEVKLREKEIALYLLFLNHPEGIAIKELALYRDELVENYNRVSKRCDRDAMVQTVDDLVNPLKNAANESISRIKKGFEDLFESYYDKDRQGGLMRLFDHRNKALKSLLVKERSKPYIISGESGSKKTITLNRRMVVDLR